MQETIQQFQCDDGHIHRMVISTDPDKDTLITVSLETAHALDPDHWIPRRHWFASHGAISSCAGGHVIVHSNCAEYIYRPMTTDVEVVDHARDPEPESVLPNNERLLGDMIEFKEVFSEEFRQDDNEMVNSLLCHFPIDDGMPNHADIVGWLSSWLDKDEDSIRVQAWTERVTLHMQRIYPCTD